jgi:hypothetical protein
VGERGIPLGKTVKIVVAKMGPFINQLSASQVLDHF